MPELLQDVAGSLVSVEEGLAALDDHRRALTSNCSKVRSEISCAVERQMQQLRSRERQLMRQVELASSLGAGAAALTAAQLQQHKGALAVTRALLDRHETSPALQESVGGQVGELHGLLQHTEKLVRVPMVSAHMDDAGLSGAVARFGRVTLPGSLSSSGLPCPPEEYGDAPHHVLHKSVPAPAVIDMRQPYLLAQRRGLQGAGAGPRRTPAMEEGEEPLLKWLARMQLEDSPPQLADVEEACQANAPCASYEQCCLGGACERGARQKAEQGQRWSLKLAAGEVAEVREGGGGEEVLAHMRQVAASEDAQWLAAEGGDGPREEDHRVWIQREEGVKREEEEEAALEACCSPKRSYIEDSWTQEVGDVRACKKPRFEGDFNDFSEGCVTPALSQVESFEESPSAPVLCEFENIKNSSIKNWLQKPAENKENDVIEDEDSKVWLASQICEMKEWKLKMNQGENNKALEEKEKWEKWYREDVNVDDGEKDKEGVDIAAVLDDIGGKEGWLWRDALRSDMKSDRSDWLSTCSSYSVLDSERSWLAASYEV